jgi:hypothetical protein
VPEVVGYPDSGRTGVRTESGAAPEAQFLLKDSDKNSVGYWDGEDGARVMQIVRRDRK